MQRRWLLTLPALWVAISAGMTCARAQPVGPIDSGKLPLAAAATTNAPPAHPTPPTPGPPGHDHFHHSPFGNSFFSHGAPPDASHPDLPPQPAAPAVPPAVTTVVPGAGNKIIQTFEGNGAVKTPVFQVLDAWEVRWSCLRVVSVAVYSSDGKLVGGAAGVLKGSIYLPNHGSYYLQISGESGAASAPAAGDAMPIPTVPGATNPTAWHVVVMQMDPSLPAVNLTVFDPNFSPPVGSGVPGSPAAPAAPTSFTDDQQRAIVRITGDTGSGAGFLVRTPDGPVVVTNLQVIANNPNFKITTTTGTVIPVVSAKAAADRDIALLSIEDHGYSYLDMSTNITQSVQPGDQVITVVLGQDNSIAVRGGPIKNIGPDRIDYDLQTHHSGIHGTPIFHLKSGKAIGVATESPDVPALGDLQGASYVARQSRRSHHFFCLRVDAVSNWLPVDLKRFEIETAFLDRFHEKSRDLDAYINPPLNDDGTTRFDQDEGAQPFRQDASIMKANALFRQLGNGNGSDTNQRLDNLRGLMFDLGNVAKTDMDQVQDMANFYPFDQARAQDEIAYRKALTAELEAISGNVDRMRTLPR